MFFAFAGGHTFKAHQFGKGSTKNDAAGKAIEAWNARASQWISVKDRAPEARKKVIAFYRNNQGKGREVMAEYIPRFTVLVKDYFDQDAEGGTEWDEAGEHEYVTESWHEIVDNWGDFSGCEIVEGEVTHWQPLPEPPTE